MLSTVCCVRDVPLAPALFKANPSCSLLRPRTTPLPEGNVVLGVIYGVLLWAGMNAATPLGAWGCSVLSRYFQFVVSSVTDLTVIAWFCRIIMQPIIPGSNPFILTNFLLQGLSSATLAALGFTAPSVSVSVTSSGPVQETATTLLQAAVPDVASVPEKQRRQVW